MIKKSILFLISFCLRISLSGILIHQCILVLTAWEMPVVVSAAMALPLKIEDTGWHLPASLLGVWRGNAEDWRVIALWSTFCYMCGSATTAIWSVSKILYYENFISFSPVDLRRKGPKVPQYFESFIIHVLLYNSSKEVKSIQKNFFLLDF